ncbi:hypothetical protein GCM10010381_66550 [Streptomyces xantholiticus]|nr:hypothetical protein GCM10010381_66550 [Streptomyces xantholiticus]
MVAIGAFELTGTAGSVLAHECRNDTRSAGGDAQAADRQAWIHIPEVFLASWFEDGLPLLTEAQLAEAPAFITERKARGEFADVIGHRAAGRRSRRGRPRIQLGVVPTKRASYAVPLSGGFGSST